MKPHERLLQVSLSIGAASAVLAGLIFFGVLDVGNMRASASRGSGSSRSVSQRTERMEWRGTVSAGQTVEVRGLNGSIEARRSDGESLVLEATKRGRRTDPASVEITVVQHEDGVRICASYNERMRRACERGSNTGVDVENNDVSVSFSLAIPAGVHLVGQTVNGSIEAAGLDGDVVAKTVNGSIELLTTGWAQGSTVNGSITAAMGATAWDRTLEFNTVNGSIELRLPDGVNTDVAATSTRGSITSEFDLTEGVRSRSRLTGMIGSGGGDLSLSTVTGAIRLVRGD